MAAAELDKAALKGALKEALAETLQEQRDLLHDVFVEVLEEFAMAEAIRDGQQTRKVPRTAVSRSLRVMTTMNQQGVPLP
jgi:hypothetical protein